MNNVMTMDVAEVYIKDNGTGNAWFFGLTTKNEVTQKIKQDTLKGGIGNGIVGLVQSDKEMGFKVTTLLNNDDLIAMQAGKAFASGTATVQKTELLKSTNGTSLTITGTPSGTPASLLVFDNYGQPVTNTFTSGTKAVTITGTNAKANATYTVVYPVQATGTIMDLDSKAFPKNYFVELHTIGYNVDTNEVVCDIYWQFDKALPNGSLTMSYEAGKANGNEVEFTAQLPTGSDIYGRYVVVPRIAG